MIILQDWITDITIIGAFVADAWMSGFHWRQYDIHGPGRELRMREEYQDLLLGSRAVYDRCQFFSRISDSIHRYT